MNALLITEKTKTFCGLAIVIKVYQKFKLLCSCVSHETLLMVYLSKEKTFRWSTSVYQENWCTYLLLLEIKIIWWTLMWLLKLIKNLYYLSKMWQVVAPSLLPSNPYPQIFSQSRSCFLYPWLQRFKRLINKKATLKCCHKKESFSMRWVLLNTHSQYFSFIWNCFLPVFLKMMYDLHSIKCMILVI